MDSRGIDRKRLSEDLDVSYTTLTDWIKGKTYPRIDKIELMARYFGIYKK
jgi:Helix-turn-helix.